MLKSIAVVLGSYLLSVVLVLATGPLLSRLFPGDFVRGRIPVQRRSAHQHCNVRSRVDHLRMAVCSFGSGPSIPACALVLCHRRSDGYCRLPSPTGARAGRTGTGWRGC